MADGLSRDRRARRLLFVAGSAYPLGGVGSWLDYLLPGLAERGWEPVLGLVEGPRHHRPERMLAAHPHERWIRIPCATGTPQGRRGALVRALAAERPAAAVGVDVPDLFAAVNARRKEGSTIHALMTVHALEPELYADAARFRVVLDAVVGTNRLACRLLEKVAGVEAGRVHYAPYGREPGPVAPTPPADGGLVVGYAGRLEQTQKRVHDIPRVAAALDRLGVRAGWRIAGAGPEEERLAAGLPPGRATFLGAVPAPELPARFYRGLDALLVPSRWETGPLVAWEAMAEGVPVVATRYAGSGLEAALVDGETALLFDVADAEGAAGALARLACEPGLRARLVAGGRRLLAERFSRERSIDGWERAFEAALARPPRPAAPDPAVPPATGRLERWLGPTAAERVRRALGRTGPDAGPGGEWPHALGKGEEREAFLRQAEALDRPGEAGCSSR
ncbi:MAG TPA: glycosyltransferase family 4 protein [Longimicrobiales bacterium]|nr:glycosyltransferase family 4 protein [Longimicrobiales bacterium]